MRGMIGCAVACGSASRQKDHARECYRERDESEIDFGKVSDWFHGRFQVLSLLYYHCDSAPIVWGSGVAQFSAL